MTYKIGQVMELAEDMETTKALSEQKVIIPKGSQFIIGADNFVHYLRDGMMQPWLDDIEIKGYDTEGISRFIVMYLDSQIDLDEMLEDRNMTMDEFAEEIECALGEIGF